MWFLWLIVCHGLPIPSQTESLFDQFSSTLFVSPWCRSRCVIDEVFLYYAPLTKNLAGTCDPPFFIEQVVKLKSKPACISYVTCTYMKPLNSGLYISHSPDRHLSHSIVLCLFKNFHLCWWVWRGPSRGTSFLALTHNIFRIISQIFFFFWLRLGREGGGACASFFSLWCVYYMFETVLATLKRKKKGTIC